MPRPQVNIPIVSNPDQVQFIPSGSTLLDCVLGGGWGQGRVINIVGDRSSGKTLLAIEACANFALRWSADNIRYAESEAAFDMEYARTIGMPDGVQIPEEPLRTVEDFSNDLSAFMKNAQGRNGPMLYILDSLDALSDDAEMGREIGEASYGTGKAKMMSEMFRRQTANLRDTNCTLIVISQIRDKIGVMFGERHTRSGGRALDFYSSQIVWLSEISKIKHTVSKVERITGVRVLANAKKNKCGLPFRRAEFTIQFGYGVADEVSMLDWIKDNGGEDLLSSPIAEYRKILATAQQDKDKSKVSEIHKELKEAVQARWQEIEDALAPPMSKYS